MHAAIKITELDKSYGSKPALKKLSLRVGQGDIFGFLGPNGAGKTTTIRCMMDFIRPNSGRIEVFGLNSRYDSEKVKRLVGYLSAEGQLYQKWNAQDHIKFVDRIRGGVKDASGFMARLDLNPKTPTRQLSTGNKQKLGLIMALMGQPKLLVLDEPTQGLDPLLQLEIYAILKEYVASGGTVFLSSHNLSEVERICKNVAVIRAGSIVASKSMDEIRAIKVHLVNASFSGKLPDRILGLPGVEVTGQHGSQVFMRVKGDINPLVAELAKNKVVGLEITHAPLEDVFMEYYKRAA